MSDDRRSPVRLLTTRRFQDDRGWFTESYHQARLAAAGVELAFVQDNHSYSAGTGTLRGIHFQRPPFAQAKLVRCIRGAIYDYAVDLRRDSPSYGQSVSAVLSAAEGNQLFIAAGFGHGFVTLAPDCEVEYKVSAFYDPASEGGIRWDDATLAVAWPLPAAGPQLSAKDCALPDFASFDSPFPYDGAPLLPLDL